MTSPTINVVLFDFEPIGEVKCYDSPLAKFDVEVLNSAGVAQDDLVQEIMEFTNLGDIAAFEYTPVDLVAPGPLASRRLTTVDTIFSRKI